jgi:hypothetical protein
MILLQSLLRNQKLPEEVNEKSYRGWPAPTSQTGLHYTRVNWWKSSELGKRPVVEFQRKKVRHATIHVLTPKVLKTGKRLREKG